MPQTLDPNYKPIVKLPPEKKSGGFDVSKAKNNVILLANEFINQSAPLITNNEELYRWNGKFYDLLSITETHKLIMIFFQDNKIMPAWKHAKAEEMIKAIKYSPNIEEVKILDDYDLLMNLNNTIINLDTKEEIPHNPRYFFSYAVDVDYDKTNTDHPNFTNFLCDLFRTGPGAKDIDMDTVYLILFIMSYLLYPQIKIEQMFIFLGIGANGKSVLIEVIKQFFPSKYVTSLSLGTLSNKETFSRNSLMWSRLNIATEDRVGNKVESEEIKKIVSGEQISMRKLYNEPIEIIPRTKFLLAVNEFFYLNDNSDGANRRLCFIEFKNKFINSDLYAKESDPTKRHLYKSSEKEKLLASILEEKTAILNTLLTYMATLKNELNWKLPITRNVEDVLEDYKAGADKLGTWLKENYEIAELTNSDPRALTTTDVLRDFRNYYETDSPGRQFKYSAVGIGKKIKQLFRVDCVRRSRDLIQPDGSYINSKVTVYPIQRKVVEDIPEPDLNPNHRPAPKQQEAEFKE